MRNGQYLVFSIMLVLVSCFIIGCTSSPVNPSQPATPGTGTGGYQDVSTPSEARNYSFEEVISRVYDIYPARSEMHIQMINGKGLDETGNASSWLFFVHDQDRTSLITYDYTGERITDWPGQYPAEEVVIDQVIPPGTLFEKNRGIIIRTPDAISTESRDLVLAGSNYTLTIKGKDTTRTLVFDATTGALTSSYEQ